MDRRTALNKNARLVKEYLAKELGWRFATERCSSRVLYLGETNVASDDSPLICQFRYDIRPEGAFSMLVFPFFAPLSLKDPVCEAVVRINNRLWHGRLDYSIEKGEVRFRMFQEFNLDNEESTQEALERLAMLPCAIVERFMPVFNELVLNKAMVADALRTVYKDI